MAGFSAWPVVARDLAEIPEPLGAELARQLEAGERAACLVYVPADPTAARRGAWARTRGGQVLALTDRRILIGAQAVGAGEPRWLACAYDQVIAWELWQSLLYGRLDLYGAPAGQPVRGWMEFNTVGVELIEAALAPLERATLGLGQAPTQGEARPITGDGLPFHFTSYLRRALLPGEVVQERIVQRAIRAPYLRFWRRIVATPALVVATDLRLLIIREEPIMRKPRYGRRSLTLPRARAPDLILRDEADGVLLEYKPFPSLLRLQLDPEHRPALQRMLAALQAPRHDPHIAA
jgi:hypothetical protein